MTVPDLATVEQYHARVIAAIDRRSRVRENWHPLQPHFAVDRALADRALDGLRRHQPLYMYRDLDPAGFPYCVTCDADDNWPCPDALDRWADLIAIGMTYGVTP